jgi:hypothetical protein
MSTPARIAVIIPNMHHDTSALQATLAQQSMPPDEVIVITGVSPNGKARNQGVAQSNAEWLVFIDDDAIIAQPDLIERLYHAAQHPDVVVAGSARILPPEADTFQRAVAHQVARIVRPITPHDIISDPIPPHFMTDITTTCCAMARSTFQACGGFDEDLIRGVDTEFFVRVQRTFPQRHFVLVAHTFVYHAAPATLAALWRKHVAYGMGHAQEVRRDPLRARAGNNFHNPLQALAWLLVRTAFIPIHLFFPFSFADPRWRIGWYPLKAFASYASAIGYIIGWYRHDH